MSFKYCHSRHHIRKNVVIGFLFNIGGFDIRVLDVLDIIIAAYFIYIVYKYVKGTVAVNIFIGIILFFILLTVVRVLEMRLLGLMLGSVAGIGLIGLMVIFQPEIRRFLLMVGDKTLKSRYDFLDKFFKQTGIDTTEHTTKLTDEILTASRSLSKDKMGGLMILTKTEVPDLVKTGKVIDARVSAILLENLFFKNAPLHDGAVVIQDDKVVAASCILPVSDNRDLPDDLGLRHRAGLGATENTNLLAIMISEENGEISYATEGKIYQNVSLEELRLKVTQYFSLFD